MGWELLQGDCLEIMRQMEPESVDAVITDPPYGIDFQSCRRKDKEKRLGKIANDEAPFVWWLYDKAQFAPRHDVIWFAVKGNYKFPGNRPASVIDSARVDAVKLLHPNEKPVSLMVQIIQSIVAKGCNILDPFAGSGSTGVAAEELGRNSIMIEIDPDYCELIRKRMSNRQTTIFEAAAGRGRGAGG